MMKKTNNKSLLQEQEDAQAEVDIWKYIFAHVKLAVVKCAIELGIAEALENHGAPMTLSELSSALGCDPCRLYRIMRILVHHQVFKEKPNTQGALGYVQTSLSRRLMKQGENSMVALVLVESSPEMLAPWNYLSAHVLANGNPQEPFEMAHGKDLWSYCVENPSHRKLVDDAMACDARLAVPAIIEGCPEVFEGVESLVDVGGGNGTTLQTLVKAFPLMRGINFDLPHVASAAPHFDGIENVGGNMFDSVPKADAAYLMWVLHDWDDGDCIKILKN